MSPEPTLLQFQCCRVDLGRGVVVRDGKNTRLTTRELALLRYLVSKPGVVVSNEELLTEVWGYAPTVVTRAISKTLHRLRIKIERDPAEPDHLQTEYGVGLRLNLSTPSLSVIDLPVMTAPPLPAYEGAFVGRLAEQQALTEQLSTHRLVTLTGPAGTGKTRLAQQHVRQAAQTFAGGAWMVDISSADSMNAMLLLISRAMAIPMNDADPEQAIQDTLKRRGRVLLVLDNVEQILAPAATLLSRWLQHAPDARFLVTSRVSMDIPGEQQLPLEVLTLEDAMTLFSLRAQAVRPSFKLSDDNRETVRALVDGLDRLSLAIELAASRVRLLSPAQLLARLDSRFALLQNQAPGRSPRQQSMQTALDISWSLLQPWEQLALAQCSVFRGGFSLEAAEAVLDLEHWPEAEEPLEAIFTLVNHSLLRVVEEHGAPPRCQMLTSVREYAAMMLARPDAILSPDGQPLTGPEATADIQHEHSVFYSALGSERSLARVELHGGQKHFLHVARELENLLAAITAAQNQNDPTVLSLCALACTVVFRRQGPFALAIQQLSTALKHTTDPHLRARLLQARGNLPGAAAAQDDLSEALQISQDVGDLRMEAMLRADLATIMKRQHSDASVHTRLEEALALSQQINDAHLEGVIRGYIAHLFYMQGRNAQAYRHFIEALALHRQVGNRPQEGAAIATLALLDESAGRYSSAIHGLERAIEISHELQLHRVEGSILSQLGRLWLQQGHLDKSITILQRAMASYRSIENVPYETLTRCNIAQWHSLQGQFHEALVSLQIGLDLARENNFRHGEGVALGYTGVIWLQMGQLENAQEMLTQGIPLLDASQPAIAGRIRGSQALVLARQGRMDDAWQALSQGEEQVRSATPFFRGLLKCVRAELAFRTDQHPLARQAIQDATAIARQIEATPCSALMVALADLQRTYT